MQAQQTSDKIREFVFTTFDLLLGFAYRVLADRIGYRTRLSCITSGIVHKGAVNIKFDLVFISVYR